MLSEKEEPMIIDLEVFWIVIAEVIRLGCKSHSFKQVLINCCAFLRDCRSRFFNGDDYGKEFA